MDMVGKLLKILKEKHGEDLGLEEGAVHYLFLSDGMFTVYLDEEEKSLKVDVEFLPKDGTHVYHSEESLADMMD